MNLLFYFVIFPGLIFSAAIGGFLSWFDRKITARVQFRQGPPILQPFYDFIKLLYKETILPKKGIGTVFLVSPVIALFGATMAAVFILIPLFNIETGFQGDLIVIFYLLTIPMLFFIFGALSSGNPLAAVGASREIKLILSYELTFILLLAVVMYKSGMSLNLHNIIEIQTAHGAFIGSASGIILFIVAIFCVQAKLGLVPFDMSEAETEITHGLFIEYSGPAYGIIKLTKYVLWFILPAFMTALFMGGLNLTGIHILGSVLKILSVVLLVTLVRNTNPRLKIHQAMKFFLIWMNLLVIVAFILAVFGY